LGKNTREACLSASQRTAETYEIQTLRESHRQSHQRAQAKCRGSGLRFCRDKGSARQTRLQKCWKIERGELEISLDLVRQRRYPLIERKGVKMARQLSLVPTIKTTVRFPEELYRRLRIKAIQEGRPVAVLIADTMEAYLSNALKQAGAPRRK
jgi:hypothetical protein